MTLFWIMATLTLTLILVAIIKRTSLGGIKFISTSIFQEKGCMEWTHMFRFVFRKQYGLMFGPIYVKNKFMLWKCKHLYFKFQSPEFPPSCSNFSDPRVGSQYQLHAAPNAYTKSQNNHKFWYFHQIFCLNDRLYTTIFSFGSHIWNQVARISFKFQIAALKLMF
jgi:hypothetical protein